MAQSSVVDASVQAFWERVEVVLRERIAPQDWCSWFSGATAVELGAEQVVIQLVNDFAARWVDDRFRAVLEQATTDVAGVPLRVVIVAAPPATRPHEQLAHAARRSDGAPSPAPAAPIPSLSPAPTGPSRSQPAIANVMTDDELRAALASSDSLPSHTLESPAPTGAAAASDSDALVDAEHVRSGVTVGDAGLAGVQRLSDRYRFDTFVIGPGNQMVHAAALSVAETPGHGYNPLFVHGPTGLGKTHLLHAIGNYVQQTRPDACVAYVTTEHFLARFMHCIQQSKTGGAGRDLRDRFKAYFRGVDVLLMDDVQFLAGRGAWVQEEVFHIFNALHVRRRQIVLTSDSSPDSIPQLEDRLRSRFAWGLIADIETPDRDTRIAILRKKARVDGVEDIPEDVFEAIAERVTSNVRELEGALTRVVASASLSGQPVSLTLAQRVLESYASDQHGPLTIERIQDIVCEHFTIQRDELLSERRSNALTLPRQIGMYLSRTLVGAPSTEVARRFNRKDHSTILYAERKIDARMREDQVVHDLVVQITERVRGRRSVGAGS